MKKILLPIALAAALGAGCASSATSTTSPVPVVPTNDNSVAPPTDQTMPPTDQGTAPSDDGSSNAPMMMQDTSGTMPDAQMNDGDGDQDMNATSSDTMPPAATPPSDPDSGNY